MEFDYIIYRIEDGIAWIQFDRSEKLNALNPDVLNNLEKTIDLSEKNDKVRVVVLTGNEKAFIAGADIEHMASGGIPLAYNLSDMTMKVQEKIANMPKPTIAAISGYALGGGCEMALCCDFRIASDNAIIGLPEINLGIIPGGGGTQRLSRLIGLGRSIELIFLGEMIKAKKAMQIGLVNKVVAQNQLEAEVTSLAKKLMERPTWSLRAAKTALNYGLNMSLNEGLRLEQDLFCMLFGTQDKSEGMRAFIEKRKPNYKGC